VVNMGVGKAVENKARIEHATSASSPTFVASSLGTSPSPARSIAPFKLRDGSDRVSVTLRGVPCGSSWTV
jgi:ribosomal protein L5